MNRTAPDRTSVRISATLLLVGQLLYIVITQMHAGGDANNHLAIFAAYARSGIWTAVRVGQFAATAILVAGIFTLLYALDAQTGTARWAARFGAASAAVALALYCVVMAVDGVALKQAVNAWVSAPDAEKAARFASAEAIRWIECGARSYQTSRWASRCCCSPPRSGGRVELAADRLPDGARRPHLPGAGLGSRDRRLHPNTRLSHRAGLGPESGMDDLADRCRPAGAGRRARVAWQ